MSKVLIAVTTAPVALPVGAVAGALRYSILDAAGTLAQTRDTHDASAEFAGVVDGDYSATVSRVDTSGMLLGNAITQQFTVSSVVTPTAPTTYDAPTGLTITVTPEA